MADYQQQIDFFPLSKAQILPNGFIRFVAPIARATFPGEKGFLNINKATGKPYYQRVSKDLLERTKGTFTGKPITHPHVPPVTLNNARSVIRGLTGSSAESIIQVDNYQFATGTIFDEELIGFIKNRVAREISPGYSIKLSPIQNDVADQLDRVGDHVAFVAKGRQGSSIALQLDESDIDWDSAMILSQYDEQELRLIKEEIRALPDNFLDLTYAGEVINFLPQKDVAVTSEENKAEQLDAKASGNDAGNPNAYKAEKPYMNTFSIVTDKQTIATFQSDATDTVDYIGRLKEAIDKGIIKQNELQTQLDAATAEVTTLKAQVTQLQNDASNAANIQTDEAAVTKKAQEIALGLATILPKIWKIKPDFQVDTTASIPELKKVFLKLASPEKASVFEALNLNDAVGVAQLDAYYDVLSSIQPVTPETQPKQQNDASAFSDAFRSILAASVPDFQVDAAASIEAKNKEAFAERDRRIQENANKL